MGDRATDPAGEFGAPSVTPEPVAVPDGQADRRASRRGLAAAIGAYVFWGLVPLFWPLLDRSGAVELLAHRIVWAFVLALLIALLVARRELRRTLGSPRALLLLALASVVISVNWGTYIWAVTHEQVVQASLGYYINPILSILAGVLVLGERLSVPQWVAVGLAAAAVVVLTVDYGRPPWVSLILAASFATYGVCKKFTDADPIVTLVIESGFVLLPSIGYLVWLGLQGRGTFGALGTGYSLLLVVSGVITVAPLLGFAYAATRLGLSTMGLAQYLAPTLQFVLGVWWFGEPMGTARWIGFGLVWLALLVLTVGALLPAPRVRLRAADHASGHDGTTAGPPTRGPGDPGRRRRTDRHRRRSADG
ncbi:EamA family transporter RarD [Naumannella halotolerans]|uniref:Chloramphenicol-sensitive protein RarD n=1 Tax=Naumannella halotolerans TaxID=993414 RepID=A0A4R7JAQ1_9ACTN|nr:EamA family transporter RarD [Naumannella halotolerans]TDT34424.1 chloramphenicol-sensitive protein RarD [Naumannella halotolerans]